MHIDFDWNSTNVNAEEQKEIEANIAKEIVHAIKLSSIESELRVVLYGDRLQLSLVGVATNTNGDALVKITYSLNPPHAATYEPVMKEKAD